MINILSLLPLSYRVKLNSDIKFLFGLLDRGTSENVSYFFRTYSLRAKEINMPFSLYRRLGLYDVFGGKGKKFTLKK